MDRQSIDLKFIYGRSIGSLLPFHRPCLYTTVFISSPSSALRLHRQKTPPDPDGAHNPEWNHPIRLYFDSNQQTNSPDLILNFDIKTQVPLLGDKLVGSVHVPLADLALDGPLETLRHVRYQVRGPDGKANGVLSFSYILNESPVRVSDPAAVQDSSKLHRELSSYPPLLNDVEQHEVYPPLQSADSKPQLYPSIEPLEPMKPFVYPSLSPDPNPQIYPLPDWKPNLYPVVSTEPVMAYPVQDSGVNGYCQYPSSLASYPQIEPVGGLASYALPGYNPPPQGPGDCYQGRGWDVRCLYNERC